MAWELWALEEEHTSIWTSPFRICSTTSWPRASLHSNCIGILKQEASGVQGPVSKPLGLGRLGFEISLCPMSSFSVCLSFPEENKWWSLRQDREFKFSLHSWAFEAALSYLIPDHEKRQKLRVMRGEKGETSVRGGEKGERESRRG